MTTPRRADLRGLHVEKTDHPRSMRDWVVARLCELPVALDRRATLVTSSESLAHQLRRHVVATLKRPDLMLGVSCLRPSGLALEILARTGQVALPGGERVRQLELLRIFQEGTLAERLRYFDAGELRQPGYVDVFARTLGELERAGLTVEELAALAPAAGSDEDRLHDLVLIWREAHAQVAGESPPHLTSAQALAWATARMGAVPEAAATLAPFIVVLTSDPSMALLRLLAVLPAPRVLLLDGRPPRERRTQRWKELVDLEEPPVEAGEETPSELARLQRRLFLTGAGTDATSAGEATRGEVDLEEYAGIDDEVDATATWVLEQIADEVPVEDIAIVAPDVDAYAPFIDDRLRRLSIRRQAATGVGAADPGAEDDATGGIALTVLDGRPASTTAAGRRLLALLRAIATGLPTGPMLTVLQALRPVGDSETEIRYSPTRLEALLLEAGIVGGTATHLAGARDWVERLQRLIEAVHDVCPEVSGAAPSAAGDPAADPLDEDEPEKRSRIRARRDAERWFRMASSLLPGVRQLDALVRRVEEGCPLASLWASIRSFVESDYRVPPDPPRFVERFAQQLAPVLDRPDSEGLRGTVAIRFLIDQLERMRVREPNRDRPAVVLASPAAVGGMIFESMRIVGLAEGVAPRSPRDDPVLPSDLRQRIEAASRTGSPATAALRRTVIERLDDTILADLHHLSRAVMGAGAHLSLSAPRQWIDGSGREVSGVLLEAATALGRSTTGGGVPTSADLRSRYFARGVERRERAACELPLLPGGVLRAVRSPAPGRYGVPPGWVSGTDPLRLADLCRLDRERDDPARFGVTDGDLATIWDRRLAPGIVPEQPLSPSKLTVLLACPHRFLLQHLLGYDEPLPPTTTDRIEPMAFGSLVHRTMELFLEEHGERLCGAKGQLSQWRQRIARAAGARFNEFQVSCSLRGAGAIESERRRLISAAQRLVTYEFGQPPRTYVATERSFGDPDAVALELGGGARVYTRGKIDRIDRLADDTFSVRDYKTGRVHSLHEKEAGQLGDLQIALYAEVLETAGRVGQDPASPAPVSEAVYVHAVAVRDPERRFDGEQLGDLRRQVKDWLRVSHRLLADGVFPRTPEKEQCGWCPFEAHCGADAPVVAGAKLSRADAPAAVRLYAGLHGITHDENGRHP